MRTKELWNNKIRKKVATRLFPLRIARDLINLKTISTIQLEMDEGLYLYGNSQTGKTIFACNLLLQIYERHYLFGGGISCQFINLPELLLQIKEGYNAGNSTAIIEKYKTTDVLLLDDIGTTKITDWVYETLFLLINYRYDNCLPTIYTSNISLDALTDLMDDDRITSRIRKSCKVLKKEMYKK